ncbi:hypothetical protein CK203_096296 [Vitis vinifera]|uniref:Uncharacterized protein n=1 Tax=Vitis vinifera TaxID=29760 RepID=A0A438FC98_VITVI|nr:hypothetical protein CK203_096296 [Vitis vinifera]
MKKLIQILQDGEKLIQDCSRCYCYQRMGGVSDEYDNLGSCNAPGPPEFMMGLDVPLKELKRRLCEDGKSGL